MSREFTNKLLEMVEDGILDRDTVIMACVKYMSEQDVEDMMHANEMIEEPEEEEHGFSFALGDDGTMDTVIVVTCNRCGESWERRYNPEPPDVPCEEWEWDRVEDALGLAREDADSEGCPKCDGGNE